VTSGSAGRRATSAAETTPTLLRKATKREGRHRARESNGINDVKIDRITVRVGCRIKRIDFRKGAMVSTLVREALGHDSLSGTIVVFRAKRADRIKLVAWDGPDLMLLWKRLERGACRWLPIC
jgi:IS66 Orf2 like protein